MKTLFCNIRCSHCGFWLIVRYQDKAWWCTACGVLTQKRVIREGLKFHPKYVKSDKEKNWLLAKQLLAYCKGLQLDSKHQIPQELKSVTP